MKYYLADFSLYDNIPKDYHCVPLMLDMPFLYLTFPEYANMFFCRGNFLTPPKELVDDIESEKIDDNAFCRKHLESINEKIFNATKMRNMNEWLIEADKRFADSKWKAVIFLFGNEHWSNLARKTIGKLFTFYKADISELNPVEIGCSNLSDALL